MKPRLANYGGGVIVFGMTEAECTEAVDLIASSPLAGDPIPATGGCRKVRLAGRGKGKRGEYRVITYFGGNDVPVFLVTVFAKGERSDLSQRERNDLRQLTKVLVESLGRNVVKIRRAP